MISQSSDTKDTRTHAIIGAAMEVHRQLGCGFLEAVYQQALTVELGVREIPFASQVELPISYKGSRLNCFYKADFVRFDAIIVEVKSLTALGGVEQAQVLNYLKATGLEVGLLINFGAQKLEFKRLVFSSQKLSAEGADFRR